MAVTDEAAAGLGEPLLTARHVAAFLGVTRHTVFRLAGKPNGIPCIKVGGALRFRPADVRAYVERRRVDHAGDTRATRLLSAATINRARLAAASAVGEGPPSTGRANDR